MVRKRGQVLAVCLLAGGALVGLDHRPAGAQAVGFQGGVSVDPEQVYVGSHFETGALIERLHFRPNVEGGFGDGFSLATINIEFIYKLPMTPGGWTFYQGSGPAVNVFRFDGRTDTRAGFNFLFGAAHDSGFFVESKFGTANSPTLKFGVGYSVRLR